MDSRTVVMGEVGLTGDIRRVPQALRRVKEAAKMGFNTFILPKGNLEDIEKDKFPDCHFLGVATLREASKRPFGDNPPRPTTNCKLKRRCRIKTAPFRLPFSGKPVTLILAVSSL